MAQSSWLANNKQQILSSGFPEKMVILDVETTGGKASYHRIIEIGLWFVENGQLVDRWQTFINPERSLPPKITELTGITLNDLKDAPTFADIADELWDWLQDRVLVAHYARFDYGFLKNEFRRLGRDYRTKPLCSVKLSRRLFPECKRHGLDVIIKRFDLVIENRHRALDDALMIYQFFAQISLLHDAQKVATACRELIQDATLPIQLPPEQVANLPNAPGVYYFYDNKDRLLYIGKSVNLKNRVLNHFSQDHSQRKDFKLHNQIAHIDYRRTPSDLGACLLENQEIKKHLPVHNVRLRRVKKMFQICLRGSHGDAQGIHIKPVAADEVPDTDKQEYGLFRTVRHASEYLRQLADQHRLCHRILGLERAVAGRHSPCFRFQLKRCAGACCGQEDIKDHNQRLRQALLKTQIKDWPWESAVVVIEQSCHEPDLTWLHLIDGWVYVAALTSMAELSDYGYERINQSAVISSDVVHKNPIRPAGFNLDVYHILNRFLGSKQALNSQPALSVLPLQSC
ncbi:exonuclease [Marinicella pacifica]|uniref:DNA-directed DNA polymerase n=1 Tax=Marinicella pacifica TaxID=1171543 RepID=A0A917CXV3_9GAMM|nr:3'-5' exonuclease family protein [Marinicella pacifica]GGG01474.1 exonuclease [Marinicella pacifica]